MTAVPRLYAIADGSFGDPVAVAARLFAGGAELVQLRYKKASSAVLHEQAAAIVAAAPDNARVIVNDRVDVARLAGAAGAHVGQGDLGPAQARSILGPDAVLGLSTHDERQALAAEHEPVDYIAVGPIFATKTKQETKLALGLERLAAICAAAHKPVVAIGGIKLENASDVLAAGASSVAVISDLIAHADIEGRTREFLNKLDA